MSLLTTDLGDVAEWRMRLIGAEASEEVKANKSQGKQLKGSHEVGEHALIYLFNPSLWLLLGEQTVVGVGVGRGCQE